MPKFSLTNKDNVIQCKWDCKANHEHYIGRYEDAVKYFGVDQNEIKSYSDIYYLIQYHQTSDRTNVKLSSELYDIIYRAQSDHYYWAHPEDRHQNALDALDRAEKAGIIYDERLLASFEKSERHNTKSRVYMHKKWLESL